MALNALRLGNAIKAAFVAAGAADNAATLLMSSQLATAIIDEFKNNAEVLPTGTPPMSTGTGPVAGKGVIT